MPSLFFYKLFAKKQENVNNDKYRLKLWLPDTVVFNDEDQPIWLYSGLDGYVYRTDNFYAKNVMNKLANYTSTDELVAVIKKANSSTVGI